MSDDDDEYGDEGFDEYGEDDFEDEDGGGKKAESKQSGKQNSSSSSSKQQSPPPKQQQIQQDTHEFVASPTNNGKISTYELNRRRQRAKDLRTIVTMSPDTSELLALSKLSPYDYYLRLVKNGAVRQSSMQTKLDSRGVKIQTDAVDYKTKECQVRMHHAGCLRSCTGGSRCCTDWRTTGGLCLM
jgi:hypothetical protein